MHKLILWRISTVTLLSNAHCTSILLNAHYTSILLNAYLMVAMHLQLLYALKERKYRDMYIP